MPGGPWWEQVYGDPCRGCGTTWVVPVAGFDGDELARVRGYAGFGPGAAVWTLDRAVRDWCEVVPLAERSDASLEHPTRGTLSVQDVVLRSRHGALHHVWDVRRTVGHRLG